MDAGGATREQTVIFSAFVWRAAFSGYFQPRAMSCTYDEHQHVVNKRAKHEMGCQKYNDAIASAPLDSAKEGQCLLENTSLLDQQQAKSARFLTEAS